MNKEKKYLIIFNMGFVLMGILVTVMLLFYLEMYLFMAVLILFQIIVINIVLFTYLRIQKNIGYRFKRVDEIFKRIDGVREELHFVSSNILSKQKSAHADLSNKFFQIKADLAELIIMLDDREKDRQYNLEEINSRLENVSDNIDSVTSSIISHKNIDDNRFTEVEASLRKILIGLEEVVKNKR